MVLKDLGSGRAVKLSHMGAARAGGESAEEKNELWQLLCVECVEGENGNNEIGIYVDGARFIRAHCS